MLRARLYWHIAAHSEAKMHFSYSYECDKCSASFYNTPEAAPTPWGGPMQIRLFHLIVTILRTGVMIFLMCLLFPCLKILLYTVELNCVRKSEHNNKLNLLRIQFGSGKPDNLL